MTGNTTFTSATYIGNPWGIHWRPTVRCQCAGCESFATVRGEFRAGSSEPRRFHICAEHAGRANLGSPLTIDESKP